MPNRSSKIRYLFLFLRQREAFYFTIISLLCSLWQGWFCYIFSVLFFFLDGFPWFICILNHRALSFIKMTFPSISIEMIMWFVSFVFHLVNMTLYIHIYLYVYIFDYKISCTTGLFYLQGLDTCLKPTKAGKECINSLLCKAV